MSGQPIPMSHLARRVIQRLEGARRTWTGDPGAARVGLTMVAEGALDCELQGMSGLSGDARAAIGRAFRARLLPRYLDLAVARNAVEARHPALTRAVVFGTATLLLVALAVVLLVPHPASVLPLVAVLGLPLSAEWRLREERLRHERLLEALASDMGVMEVAERLHGSYESVAPGPQRVASMVARPGF